jgi:ubiquitin-conjugating enzyme E2 O
VARWKSNSGNVLRCRASRQHGSVSSIPTGKRIEPDGRIEAFPGHSVTWIDDDGRRRTGIVQTFDAEQRTAELLMHDTLKIEAVSALELDPGSDDDIGLGVILGEEVLLCDDNRSPTPHVPPIGQPPDRLGDEPMILSDLTKNGTVKYQDVAWESVRREASDIDWFGEVVFLHNDGEVSVLLSNGTTVKVPTTKLYKLNHIEDGEVMDGDDDDEYYDEDEDEEMGEFQNYGMAPMSSLMSYLGGHLPRSGHVSAQEALDFLTEESEASWETTSNEDDDMGAFDVLANGTDTKGESQSAALPGTPPTGQNTSRQPEEGDTDMDSGSDDAHAVEKSIPLIPPSPATAKFLPQPVETSSFPPTTSYGAGPSKVVRNKSWESFQVHEIAPTDHHFYAQHPASLSRARMKKLHQEHKSLDTSLPGMSSLAVLGQN